MQEKLDLSMEKNRFKRLVLKIKFFIRRIKKDKN